MNNNTALRTVFNWEKTENPIQIILKHYEPSFEYLDLTLPSIRNKMGGLKDIKERDLARKLDIRTVPYRLTLCKLEEDQAEFIISNHHILYDGWSNGIILREFMYAYHSYSNGAIPKITTKSSYKNYLKLIADKNKSNPLLFWNNYLHEYEMTDLLPVNPSANLSSAIKQVQ